MQIAGCAALFIADLAGGAVCNGRAPIARIVVSMRQGIRESAQRQPGGTLEPALLSVYRLQLTDPHRAVPSSAANGAVTAGDDRTRPARQVHLRPRVEQSEAAIEQAIFDARKTVGGMDLAQDGCGLIAAPIDGTLRLPQQRLPTVPSFSIAVGQRTQTRRGTGERRAHRGDGAFGHLVAIQAALARGAHRKRSAGPDGPGVQFALRLQNRDSPAPYPPQDRPVERRRTAIARRPRMYNEAQKPLPERRRNRALQKRRQYQIRPEQPHRLARDTIVNVQFDRQLVTIAGQLNVQPLR